MHRSDNRSLLEGQIARMRKTLRDVVALRAELRRAKSDQGVVRCLELNREKIDSLERSVLLLKERLQHASPG